MFTKFLYSELLEKVVSTCMNMASKTWFDPDCAFFTPKMGVILGYGIALISWIPEGADTWQACPG